MSRSHPAPTAAPTDRPLRTLVCCAALLLCLLPIDRALAAPPTVNGLFHGDGDDGKYLPYATSEYGSDLYAYFDAPSSRLFVALVVDQTLVNDVVCSPQSNQAYTTSAGWSPPRPCNRLVDSEFAEFTLECAPDSVNAWTWRQGFACATTDGTNPSNWVSDSTCGASTVPATWPPSIVSSSSFAKNVNAFQANPSPAWDLYALGNGTGNWKSPFLPAPNNDDVTLVPGYPTYSADYEWEWSMVYEWSVELGASGTNCGDQPIYFITGSSHHSPAKNGDENDDFPPLENPIFSDWGDLPNTYGTTSAESGARHYLTVAGPYLGADIQAETDGQPTAAATGDGDEEDGVTANVASNWTVGSTQTIDVEVSNASGGALLGAWFDWNGDGDFADAGEFFSWSVTQGTNTLEITVGSGFDWQDDDLFARFRLFSDASKAPGGSLTQAGSTGVATDGEVEDYTFAASSLPVTLNAFASEPAGRGELTARWQTASETDNVGFELWGLVRGEWQPLGEMVPSQGMNSALPQSYEVRVTAPDGLGEVKLVDYDSRGRAEQFGPFRVGESYGETQPEQRVDWSGPRARRDRRLEERGFSAPGGRAGWKKVERGAPIRGAAAHAHGSSARSVATPGRTIEVESGPSTHVAVTVAGIQRVTYEALRDGGLDLAGVRGGDIAVTWRGEAVERWIGGAAIFGPGSSIEFVGRPPQGDEALYLDAALYQVSVDPLRARDARQVGAGAANRVSPSYRRTETVDTPRSYNSQSPTGDPWIDRSVFVRGGRQTTLTLDLPLDGPVLAGPGRLIVGLGTITDLPDLTDAGGAPIPEHQVEVWFAGPDGAFHWAASASTSGQRAWTIEADLPTGLPKAGLNRVQLRFTTPYQYSLVVVDHYGVEYAAPYVGPTVAFPADPTAKGYRVTGFDHPAVVAYAEERGGALTRIEPRVSPAGGGYSADLRSWEAERFWVTDRPHAPDVFTTGAPDDLLAAPADLVVIAGSSFVGSAALDEYLAQTAHLDPVVVDVEDVYNSVGYGMALPGAITDYLAARNAVHPFTHVQLVGTDCYDRLNHVSSCLSFVPLPTAAVGPTLYSPSQNRLVDLDGDGVGDAAVGQFSVRDETELATIVAKGASWRSSGLSATPSALLIAEESDGLHSFLGQIDRLKGRLAWRDIDVLDMARHPQVATARDALSSSLASGRAVTVFSGHSSPSVWAFRGLLTAGSVASLPNVGLPTVMVPLACETTYDISPNANVLGHQLLYAGDRGALAISGAVALSSLSDNENMARHVLDGLKRGLTLGEAVLDGRRALGAEFQTLQDNWMTQGDVTVRLQP